MNAPIPFDDYLALFAPFGGTDSPYLRLHFPRYVETKQRLLSHWDRPPGAHLLDLGAHWLHQSLLYAIDDFDVTALDMPATFNLAQVSELAEAHAIRLLANAELEHPTGLADVADNSFDVILFTEIIEHLTFNPVALWREVHRVLKPGGRIVITTPNYYALRTRARQALRFLSGRGGGVAVAGILHGHTYTHHWKEYSLRELRNYFSVLSPDFSCAHRLHVTEYETSASWSLARRTAHWIEHAIPLLRPHLYLEVVLRHKDHGIVVSPHW